MLLVLSVDGLSAGALGCYGNDWVGTPAIDVLAADGVVYDFAISDVPSLDALRSFWSGTSPCCRARANSAVDHGTRGLAAEFEAAAGHSLLFTDDRSILDFPEAAAFGDQVSVAMPDNAQLAGEAGETHLATFFANSAELVLEFAEQSSDGPAIAWLHTSSLASLWDAPLDYRKRYCDEEDPEPPELASPPHSSFSAADAPDPDELLGLRRAYAGQVALLDEMLESFIGFLQQSGLWEQVAFVLTSPRGFGLGQHGVIGYPDGLTTLHEENLHVPFLFRMPERTSQPRQVAVHEPALLQPSDLLSLMCEFFALKHHVAGPGGDDISAAGPPQQDERATRQLAFSVSPAETQSYAVRSAAWHLISQEVDGGSEISLYAKPDDRWEMNNVADRCAAVVEQLQTHTKAILAGDALACQTELDEALTAPHE